MDSKLFRLGADTIRILSAEAIQKAKSGHPGMPMGCADYAFVLWSKYLRHNPQNPTWLGRDRFVLSAGHGSMLIYSLLHLFNYGLPMSELENFRQWASKTPGHPEFGHTKGVDITTGPLGSGFGSAVGMAIASKQFAARTGLDQSDVKLGKIYVISGDGCLMEGNSAEAASLAGHLKLDNIVVFYDSNAITIEGSTNLAFSEDVAKRFDACHWRVLQIPDANDAAQIDKVLSEAQQSDGRPTLIIGKTTIGFGSPNKGGKAGAHGEPLGEEELELTKRNLNWTLPPFTVPEELKAALTTRTAQLATEAAQWDAAFRKATAGCDLVEKLSGKYVPENLLEELLKAAPVDKAVATRASGGTILQKAAELVPALTGGAADLAPSTKSNLKNETDFSAENRAGRNLHFGIRELEMGMAANGMALFGTTIPYSSTFTVFSDYMKPAIRLAALQNLQELYIFTHDSFYVGEDGPTHEPIEQLTMLRSIPGMTVYRPAEAHEVAHCYAAALRGKGPAALLLTRQNLDPFTAEEAARIDVTRGAYVLSDEKDFEVIVAASGSEVNLALGAARELRAKGIRIRVVSVPSLETFLRQDEAYRKSVFPCACRKRVSVEAGSTAMWYRIVGLDGLAIGLDHFGASAPYKVLAEEFGFTVPQVAAKIAAYLGK
ncbi:MAG: transketolase [Victivallaceae bacterium]|nr:transketolase [Victivallaceae bacterium]